MNKTANFNRSSFTS